MKQNKYKILDKNLVKWINALMVIIWFVIFLYSGNILGNLAKETKKESRLIFRSFGIDRTNITPRTSELQTVTYYENGTQYSIDTIGIQKVYLKAPGQGYNTYLRLTYWTEPDFKQTILYLIGTVSSGFISAGYLLSFIPERKEEPYTSPNERYLNSFRKRVKIALSYKFDPYEMIRAIRTRHCFWECSCCYNLHKYDHCPKGECYHKNRKISERLIAGFSFYNAKYYNERFWKFHKDYMIKIIRGLAYEDRKEKMFKNIEKMSKSSILIYPSEIGPMGITWDGDKTLTVKYSDGRTKNIKEN